MDTYFRDLFAHHIFMTYMATLPVGILTAMAAAVGDPSLMMRLDRRAGPGRLGGAVDGDVGHGPRVVAGVARR